eukprot:c20280_g1_i1.p1 GENE.c20280_g1_i1~~c20280_g1_i1.p1  ORF type:complete len:355 (+),score=81.45 c20280_g1_i1:1-1065(+)
MGDKQNLHKGMWGLGARRLASFTAGSTIAVASAAISWSYGDSKPKHELRFAGVEGGGTTWRVAIAVGHPTNIVEKEIFDTTTPEETLGKVKAWLKARQFDSLGIASFGPVDLNEASPTYGYITTTPKPGWNYAPVVGPLTKDFPVPFAFDTDVNAPAMAEFRFNAKPGQSSCAYVTVGTGVGVGLVINGQCVHGMMHPEGGHISCLRHPSDHFPTVNHRAPFLGTSVESFTNSEALAMRAGVARRDLGHVPDDNIAWEHASHYLASLCANMILLVSPERIVLAGGIMNRDVMFPSIRQKVREMLNGYIDMPQINTDLINEYIGPSKYGNDIGIIGALVLAENAYFKANPTHKSS